MKYALVNDPASNIRYRANAGKNNTTVTAIRNTSTMNDNTFIAYILSHRSIRI